MRQNKKKSTAGGAAQRACLMTGVGQSHSSPEWVEQAPLSGSSGTEGVPDDWGASVPQRCTIECATAAPDAKKMRTP